MSAERKKAFEKIYADHTWGGKSRSGPGSDPEHTVEYVRFVERWLGNHPDCRSVVEFGCGDWATSRLINFGQQREYLGLDIVQTVIEQNQKTFAAPGIRFDQCDFLLASTPKGDLLLIKDVLQHLSNESVQEFLDKVLPNFRYALLTNDVAKYVEKCIFGVPVFRHRLAKANIDVADGGSRPLRLDEKPFKLEALEKFAYPHVLQTKPRRVVYIKEVFVWGNKQCFEH